MGGLWTTSASATSMELALVLDGSGSINASNWQLQLQGYKDAFASGTFYDDYVAPSPYDTLYVGVYQFATNVVQEIGWTAINNNTDATAFGNMFTFAQLTGWTDTQGAVQHATDGLLGNGIASAKMVMDISTDGNPTLCDGGTSSYSTNCPYGSNPTLAAIQAANSSRANGVTINALGVGNYVNSTFLDALVGINPVSNPEGFYLRASDFGQFGATLETKLGREITNVPEPASILLLLAGMIGIFASGTRRRFA